MHRTIAELCTALREAGAVPTLISLLIGALTTTGSVKLEASGSFENSVPVLFDGLVPA